MRVVNARFIKPIDKQMMKAILNEGLPILTIEEAVLEGGLAAARFLNTLMTSACIIHRLTEWASQTGLLNTAASNRPA